MCQPLERGSWGGTLVGGEADEPSCTAEKNSDVSCGCGGAAAEGLYAKRLRDGVMKSGRQTTLGARAAVSGIGVHSGQPASLTFHPAEANTGVVFIRTDERGRQQREVRAQAQYVTATALATVLGDDNGPCVSTIEHIMAALCGLGVDNVLVEIDGPETPIMDGSAAAFVAAIDQAGVVTLAAPRRFTKVLKPIRVEKGDAFGELTPCDRGF